MKVPDELEKHNRATLRKMNIQVQQRSGERLENEGKCLKRAKDKYEQRVNLHVTWHI